MDAVEKVNGSQKIVIVQKTLKRFEEDLLGFTFG
jgi:hypothetical protein